jgi:hypothetical protein
MILSYHGYTDGENWPKEAQQMNSIFVAWQPENTIWPSRLAKAPWSVKSNLTNKCPWAKPSYRNVYMTFILWSYL